MKIKNMTKLRDDPNRFISAVVVQRSCTAGRPPTKAQCVEELVEGGRKSVQCFCNTNLCNSSSLVMIIWPLLAFLPFILRLM